MRERERENLATANHCAKFDSTRLRLFGCYANLLQAKLILYILTRLWKCSELVPTHVELNYQIKILPVGRNDNKKLRYSQTKKKKKESLEPNTCEKNKQVTLTQNDQSLL